MTDAPHLPTEFVRRLAARLAGDDRIEALWLEGDDDTIQWPPYAHLDLHFAVPEPFVDGVRGDLLTWLPELDDVSDVSQQEAPFKGFAGSARLSDGTPLTYRVERTSQLGKVPRRQVNMLLDRSGGLLLPGLSFEA